MESVKRWLNLGISLTLVCVILAVSSQETVRAEKPGEKFEEGFRLDKIDLKVGKLGHLAPYIGTYWFEKVFEDPHVKKRMEQLLGDRLSHFMKNVDVRGAIEFQGSKMVLRGGRAHETHRERAILIVNVYDGKIHAGIFSEGRTTIFSREKRYGYLSSAIREWVRLEEIETMVEKPPAKNFEWVK